MHIATEHPARFALTNELHARPFPAVNPPEQVLHFALLLGEQQGDADFAHLLTLCRRFGIAPPETGAKHYFADFGSFRLKWERHAEFATFTVFRDGVAGEPFAETAARNLPADWLQSAPGELIVATQIAVMAPSEEATDPAALGRWFVTGSLCGSTVGNGAVEIWTDFRIHADGASRFLLCGPRVDQRRVGRLVQRILEIETYRTLALLGLPVARSIGRQVAEMERDLAQLIAAIGTDGAPDQDANLLGRLMTLARHLEELIATSSFRFGATSAYSALVEARLRILKEVPVAGRQTLREFLDRRLIPAVRTCATMSGRLEDLHQRLARSANLLRTRVEIALERQNGALLASMNRRARQQLRLQETVEGLSAAAISYYVVGLVAYIAKPFGDAMLPWITAAAVPVVLVLAFIVSRRIRAAQKREDA